MGFLRKASYKDIIGSNKENQFLYYDNLPARYKEFELYLTQEDLEELNSNENIEKLIKNLKENSAVISAIHCPESCFRTCNETEEMSSNYLSLCEILKDDKSRQMFLKLIKLADKICQKQTDNTQMSKNDEDDDGELDSTSKKKKSKQIIVILHEGCENGCVLDEQSICCKKDDFVDMIYECIKDLKIESSIKLALENVTPFYSYNNTIEKGNNCGWKKDNQICNKNFFTSINGKLKNIQFGACIDFCHIMVSEKIYKTSAELVDALNNYFDEIDYKEYILLFHVSNCGEELSHGQLFSFENEQDKKVLEKIRMLCKESGKDIPITFEMADGTDAEKARLNYEHIMYYFSNKHIFGKFSEFLNDEDNKELKDFFDNLFIVYSYDKKNVFEITNSLWKVKQIILNNTFVSDEKKRFFGFDFDSTEVNLSLVRLKAYVYYTRFCNLGNFLADNYYSGENCIWDDERISAKDFGLAMKYFLFNDKIHQCVYTGIQYKFLIDFLPKKENFVRFNDGITETTEMKIDSENNIFKQVIGKIPAHISGTSIGKEKKGTANFYSVGKNFGQCLFKYFDSSNNNWSLRIYENQPINYVKCGETRYSIQAFTQLALQGGFNDETIDLSLDISRFASGRDVKTSDTSSDTLEGFLKFFDSNNEFAYEKVASISDEEILFTKLPNCTSSYTLTKQQGAILKAIFVNREWQRSGDHCQLEYQNDSTCENADFMSEAINEINKGQNDVIWTILDKIKEQYDLYKINKDELEKLNVYSGLDKEFYEKQKGKIKCVWEKKADGEK